jgi:hypothetical protein
MTEPYILYLDDIEHLFVAPDFNWRSAHPRETSGIEALFLQLQLQSQPLPDKLLIYLPADQVTPELTQQVEAGINRYATMKIKNCSEALTLLRRRGLRGLLYGITFLIICGLIAYTATIVPGLPLWLSGFIYNGFSIIGWVSLWHPTEALLYDWFEPWRDRRLSRHMETMALEIKAA